MIWQSIWLMTSFDVLIIGVSVLALAWLARRRTSIAIRGGAGGLAAISFGLILVALFYLTDLLIMHVVPRFIPMAEAMVMMEALHLNADWPLSLIAVGSIAFGIVAVAQRLLALTESLEAAGERLNSERAARHELTDEVSRSESSLANAQRIAHVGNWDWDVEADSLHWSDETFRVFGLVPGKAKATRELFEQSVHPEDRERVEEASSKTYRTHEPHSIRFRIVRPDGDVRHVHGEAELTPKANGPGFRMCGTVQDVTALVRAEQELQEREAHLRAVMDTAADGIITIDVRGVIESVNRSAENIFGYSEKELLGRNVSMLTSEPDRREHDGYLSRYLATGEARILGVGPREVRGLRRDGQIIPIELAIAEASIAGKRIFVGVLRDITERKRQEEQLQQAQKMEAVGQLTGGVAHDFNNILTSIFGNLEFLKGRPGTTPEDEGYLDAALKSARRAADLTKQLLAFSRKQTLAPVPTDVDQLVNRMASLMRRTLGEGIDIETVQGRGTWAAMVDPNQLENALLNLGLNARDAMGGAGKLTIETANVRLDTSYTKSKPEVEPGPYLMLSVSDTGVGMGPEVADQAFEPFFTTKETGKGSGLGLSMVYGFVKQSGGHIEICSEIEGGTTMKIYLPPAEGKDAPGSAPPPAQNSIPTGTERILVVEDDADVRGFVELALGSLGYTVIAYPDGSSALDHIEGIEKIDLLLTDVVLPGGMNGDELARKVQARYPHIHVLFTSGYVEDSIIHDGRKGSELNLLAKPYRRDSLAERVRDTLDRK